jgi:glucose/arabinose dehydrogenase
MILSRTAVVMALIAGPALAGEPDDLTLPQGFHANIVAEGLGPVRHLVVRDNGDIYLSTGRGVAREGGDGIIAVHLRPDHRTDRIEHFGVVDGGTGIAMWHGALYAASPSRIYRFVFHGDALLPDPEPTVIVDNIAKSKQSNHGIAIDKKGDLFVTDDGTDNICTASNNSNEIMPAGLQAMSGSWHSRRNLALRSRQAQSEFCQWGAGRHGDPRHDCADFGERRHAVRLCAWT